MINQSSADEIYEKPGVFGDEKKYLASGDRLKKMLEITQNLQDPPTTVLDIATGTGLFANEVLRIFPHANVYAVDISKKAISIGKNKYKNIKFKNANAEIKLPYRSNIFDFVISGEHIPCVKNTDTYLMEINRVLKINGKLMITTPNLTSWLNRILLLFGKSIYFYEVSFKRTIPVLRVFNRSYPDITLPPTGLTRIFDINTLVTLLGIYGFEVSDIFGVSLLSSKFIKPIDQLFSHLPTFASGIILKAVKMKNL